MDFKEPTRLVLTASLLYSAFLIWKCPCEKLCACQLTEFYTATLVPLAVITYANARNVTPSLQ
jgi:hypothetical protein